MTPLQKDFSERFARLVAYDVPDEQIARVMQMNVEDVTRYRDHPDVKAAVAQRESTLVAQMDTLNSGWNNVEAMAVSTVMHTLQSVPDPQFALQAAVAANKAHRRGMHANKPISVANGNGEGGARAVLNLNVAFVNKVQSGEANGVTVDVGASEQKRTNMMTPGDITAMLDHQDRDNVAGQIVNQIFGMPVTEPV